MLCFLGPSTSSVIENTVHYWFKRRHSQPPDHYFHTHLAHACLALNLVDMAHECLSLYFSLKNKGHLEFNKLALLSIITDYPNMISSAMRDQIELEVFNNKFSVNFTTETGNNWLFLRALIHLKIFLLKKNTIELDEFSKYLEHIIAFEADGMFYDYPPQGTSLKKNEPVIPLTYSFKMLAILLEIHNILADNELLQDKNKKLFKLITKSLSVHLAIIAPDGESLYFGRSDNTLFGYANLLYILENINTFGSSSYLNEALSKFVTSNFCENDIIKKCIPYGGYRDNYIYDSVYIAYFISKSLQRHQKTKILTFDISKIKTTTFLETKIGFIFKNKGTFLFVSSHGSKPDGKPDEFFGYRYSGLTPLKVLTERDKGPKLLSCNRININNVNTNLPFVARQDFFFFSVLHINYDEISKTIEKKITISSTSTPSIFIKNKILKKIFSILANKLPLYVTSYIKKLFLKKFSHSRTLIVDFERKLVSIQDVNNKFSPTVYILPKHWYLRATEYNESIANSQSRTYRCKSKVVNINYSLTLVEKNNI